jgi:hypothetical protein
MLKSRWRVRRRAYLVRPLRPFQVYRLAINDLKVGQLQFGDEVSGTDKSGRRTDPRIGQLRGG